LEEGWGERAEQLSLQREVVKKDMEMMTTRSGEYDGHACDE
jgi:hypothetical protein